MKRIFPLILGVTSFFSVSAASADPLTVDPYSVVWTSPSLNSSGSMPLGNGDIALNAWMEADGSLLFYIAKTDAVSENGQFLKLGLIRVEFTPRLPVDTAFRQELSLKQGVVTFASGEGERKTEVRLWVDANRPVIHCDTASGQPLAMKATAELWRLKPRTLPPEEVHSIRELADSPEPVIIDPDVILPASTDGCVWLHRNDRSTYPAVMQNQHLGALMEKYPDPLLHRTFGCLMQARGGKPAGDLTVEAPPTREQHLAITVLTAQTPDVNTWRRRLLRASADAAQVPSKSRGTST